MLWGSGAMPSTGHGHLKQDYAIAHVSVCGVYLLVAEFTVPVSLNDVTIMTAVLVKAVKASVPDGRMHAFDVLLD